MTISRTVYANKQLVDHFTGEMLVDAFFPPYHSRQIGHFAHGHQQWRQGMIVTAHEICATKEAHCMLDTAIITYRTE